MTEVFREYDRAKPYLLKAEKVIIDTEMKKECYAALARIAMHEGDMDGLDRYLEKAEGCGVLRESFESRQQHAQSLKLR